jgi:hypothetical protein
MSGELSIPAVLFTGVIIYGLYKLIIEPIIGGGRKSHGDHYRRR